MLETVVSCPLRYSSRLSCVYCRALVGLFPSSQAWRHLLVLLTAASINSEPAGLTAYSIIPVVTVKSTLFGDIKLWRTSPQQLTTKH